MNTKFSFGSYYPAESILHTLDPRTKLLAGVLFLIATLCTHTWISLSVLAIYVLVAYLVSRVPFRYALSSLAPLLMIALIAASMNLFLNREGDILFHAGIITITTTGAHLGKFMLLRISIMMAGMSLITLTTTTKKLTQGLEVALSSLRRFHVPAHEIGMIFGIALRFMPQFATELSSIYKSQTSRGSMLKSAPASSLGRLTSLIVPLFTSIFRRSDTLAGAMEARCYHGGSNTTTLYPLHMGARDGAMIVISVVILVTILVLNFVI